MLEVAVGDISWQSLTSSYMHDPLLQVRVIGYCERYLIQGCNSFLYSRAYYLFPAKAVVTCKSFQGNA